MVYTIVLVIGLAGIIAIGLPRLITAVYSISRIHTVEKAPSARAAIVFGAGLHRDGSPTPVLQDRVATAARLYFSGQVEKILMSGDNRFMNYNEPGAMLEFALALGVPREDIVLDYAGRRTYDTCYRAGAIFGLQKAILVTQRFHLPRAIFICNMLGIQGQGVIADQRVYTRYARNMWALRELPATLMALWDVWIARPLPVLGEPEPIFSDKISHPIPSPGIKIAHQDTPQKE